MSSGFVKLWEETIYNDVWCDDPTAWRIFEYLLISAYRGKPQGTTSKTTQQITDACFPHDGKNSTTYSAIRRLEKAEMIKTKSTNRKTTFKIQNWWKYQGNGSLGKNEAKTEQERSKTLIRTKNKDKEIYKEKRVGHYKTPAELGMPELGVAV